MRRQLADQAAYYDWAREGLRVPLIERTFAWLDEHFPADEGAAGLCWGDARIGNILYDGFRARRRARLGDGGARAARGRPGVVRLPAHLLRGPRRRLRRRPACPTSCALDDCAASYERQSGRTPRHLHWYTVYAALRYAIVSIRTTKRRVHFDGIEFPADPDDLIMHKDGLERLLGQS